MRSHRRLASTAGQFFCDFLVKAAFFALSVVFSRFFRRLCLRLLRHGTLEMKKLEIAIDEHGIGGDNEW